MALRTFAPRPTPRLLTPAELARITCDVRAGDGLDNAEARRLLDHITVLKTALGWQESRIEPGQVGAVVESRVPDDPAEIGRRRA